MNDRLEMLHTRYATSLARKRVELLRIWDALQLQVDDTALHRELHDALHRLSGSAGAYGYTAIGGIALRMDVSLNDWLQIAPAQRSSARVLLDGLHVDMAILLGELADA